MLVEQQQLVRTRHINRWISMLVFRVLLITLTLGYGGIGLVWELQGVDVQHLTAWDKVCVFWCFGVLAVVFWCCYCGVQCA